YNPIEATALQDRLERIKWRLWHGNADEALNRARELAEDVAALSSGYPGLARLVKATAGLATYLGNNFAAIADYAERWDHGEIISTAFAESTVDLVVSRRFVKSAT
ncbi:MAG: ISKra4 family transposase, partial [Microvirga sp.]